MKHLIERHIIIKQNLSRWCKLIVLIYNGHVSVFFLWDTQSIYSSVSFQKVLKYWESPNELKKEKKNYLFEMSQH